MEILEFIKNIDKSSWIILGCFSLFLVIIYIKRSSDIVKKIVLEAINEAECKFNSGEGQQKLDFAVDCIKIKLPFILGIFLTKNSLVSIIEGLLNTVSHTFNLNKQVDIKGNDTIITFKEIKINKKEIDVELDTRSKSELIEASVESDTEVYANVKTKTDWKDNTETSVEVGIKKKL